MPAKNPEATTITLVTSHQAAPPRVVLWYQPPGVKSWKTYVLSLICHDDNLEVSWICASMAPIPRAENSRLAILCDGTDSKVP